jgi:hypothetical protein
VTKQLTSVAPATTWFDTPSSVEEPAEQVSQEQQQQPQQQAGVWESCRVHRLDAQPPVLSHCWPASSPEDLEATTRTIRDIFAQPPRATFCDVIVAPLIASPCSACVIVVCVVIVISGLWCVFKKIQHRFFERTQREATTATDPAATAATTTHMSVHGALQRAADAAAATAATTAQGADESPSRSTDPASSQAYLRMLAQHLVKQLAQQETLSPILDHVDEIANTVDHFVLVLTGLTENEKVRLTVNGAPFIKRDDAFAFFGQPVKDEKCEGGVAIPFHVRAASDEKHHSPIHMIDVAQLARITIEMRSETFQASVKWASPAAAEPTAAAATTDPRLERAIASSAMVASTVAENQLRGGKTQLAFVSEQFHRAELGCVVEYAQRAQLAFDFAANPTFHPSLLQQRLATAGIRDKAASNKEPGKPGAPLFFEPAAQEAAFLCALLLVASDKSRGEELAVMMRIRLVELLDAAEGKPEAKKLGESARAAMSHLQLASTTLADLEACAAGSLLLKKGDAKSAVVPTFGPRSAPQYTLQFAQAPFVTTLAPIMGAIPGTAARATSTTASAAAKSPPTAAARPKDGAAGRPKHAAPTTTTAPTTAPTTTPTTTAQTQLGTIYDKNECWAGAIADVAERAVATITQRPDEHEHVRRFRDHKWVATEGARAVAAMTDRRGKPSDAARQLPVVFHRLHASNDTKLASIVSWGAAAPAGTTPIALLIFDRKRKHWSACVRHGNVWTRRDAGKVETLGATQPDATFCIWLRKPTEMRGGASAPCAHCGEAKRRHSRRTERKCASCKRSVFGDCGTHGRRSGEAWHCANCLAFSSRLLQLDAITEESRRTEPAALREAAARGEHFAQQNPRVRGPVTLLRREAPAPPADAAQPQQPRAPPPPFEATPGAHTQQLPADAAAGAQQQRRLSPLAAAFAPQPQAQPQQQQLQPPLPHSRQRQPAPRAAQPQAAQPQARNRGPALDGPTWPLERVGQLFQCGHGIAPTVAALRSNALERVVIRQPKDIPALAMKGHTSETHNRHFRCLVFVKEALKPYPPTMLLTDALVRIFSAQAEERNWQAATLEREMANAAGSFSNLPLYTNSPIPLRLDTSPVWKSAIRAAGLDANESQSASQPAVQLSEIEMCMANAHSLAVRILIMLTWLCGGRVGDVRKVRLSEVRFNEQTGELMVGFLRGKGARFAQPYHVPSTVPASWRPALSQFLAGFATEHPQTMLFPEPLTGHCLGKQVTDTLRTVRPELGQRAMRRGSLQAMAQNGVDLDTLRIFSGHRNVLTLLRYLNWSKDAAVLSREARAAARYLDPEASSRV